MKFHFQASSWINTSILHWDLPRGHPEDSSNLQSHSEEATLNQTEALALNQNTFLILCLVSLSRYLSFICFHQKGLYITIYGLFGLTSGFTESQVDQSHLDCWPNRSQSSTLTEVCVGQKFVFPTPIQLYVNKTKTFTPYKQNHNKQYFRWAVVVAQLVEWWLPIPDVRSSNPVISKNLYWTFTGIYIWKDENKEKEAWNGPFLKNIILDTSKNSHLGPTNSLVNSCTDKD